MEDNKKAKDLNTAEQEKVANEQETTAPREEKLRTKLKAGRFVARPDCW